MNEHGVTKDGSKNTPSTFAQDIAEMMRGWNTIVGQVRAVYPHATEEDVYQIAKGAMNKSLEL